MCCDERGRRSGVITCVMPNQFRKQFLWMEDRQGAGTQPKWMTRNAAWANRCILKVRSLAPSQKGKQFDAPRPPINSLKKRTSEIWANRTNTACSSKVVWEFVFKGFTRYQHRQRTQNKLLDRFGCRPTPVYFENTSEHRVSCSSDFLHVVPSNLWFVANSLNSCITSLHSAFAT